MPHATTPESPRDPADTVEAVVELIAAVIGRNGATVYAEMPAEVVAAFTIPRFAEAYGLSVPVVKRILKRGEGPEIVRVGDRKRPTLLITWEAAQAWARSRTRPYEPDRTDWFVTPDGERTRPWANAKNRRKAEAGEASGAAA